MPFRPLTPKEKQEDERLRPCLSSEHNPPSMLVLPPGLHVWVCPACHKETTIRVLAIMCQPSRTDLPLQPVVVPDISSIDELRRQLETWRAARPPSPPCVPQWRAGDIPMNQGTIDFGSHPAGVTSSMLASFRPVPADQVPHYTE